MSNCFRKNILLRAMMVCQSILYVVAVFSQERYFHAEPFPLLNEMPSGCVRTAWQDRDGFMWFGTEDGLCRYDGYQLLTYRNNAANSHLLSSNNVLHVEDCGNYTLIGTDAGLNILDHSNNQIRQTGFPDLDNYEIRSIVPDGKGNIWVGTYKRLLKLSSDLKHCERYDSKGVPVTSVNSVFLDHGGTLWVMYWKKGLYRYNPRRDYFERMPRLGKTDNPFRLFQDSRGRYWLSSWREGMYSMHLAKGGKAQQPVTYHPIILDKGDADVSTNYFSIVQDRANGYLWMVGDNGLSVARPDMMPCTFSTVQRCKTKSMMSWKACSATVTVIFG